MREEAFRDWDSMHDTDQLNPHCPDCEMWWFQAQGTHCNPQPTTPRLVSSNAHRSRDDHQQASSCLSWLLGIPTSCRHGQRNAIGARLSTQRYHPIPSAAVLYLVHHPMLSEPQEFRCRWCQNICSEGSDHLFSCSAVPCASFYALLSHRNFDAIGARTSAQRYQTIPSAAVPYLAYHPMLSQPQG